jgi:phage shock protein PspC (stress-responsive transcriptional regulator)
MRSTLVIIGAVIGFVIFIIVNFMITFAPDPLLFLTKPLLCPDGEFESYSSNYRASSGQTRSGTNTDCELKNGEKYNIDTQMVGLTFLVSCAPVGITAILAWIIGLFRPRPRQPEIVTTTPS